MKNFAKAAFRLLFLVPLAVFFAFGFSACRNVTAFDPDIHDVSAETAFAVTFNPNGAFWDETKLNAGTKTVSANSGGRILPPGILKPFYHFIGWHDNDGREIDLLEYEHTRNQTLYARWELRGALDNTDLSNVQAHLDAHIVNETDSSPDNPIPLVVAGIALGNMTAGSIHASNRWFPLFQMIEDAGKFVSLDLSNSFISTNGLSANTAIPTGKYWVVSLAMPGTSSNSTPIPGTNLSGTYRIQSFGAASNGDKHFKNLSSVSGRWISELASNTFRGSGDLAKANFPGVVKIGDGVFARNPDLISVFIPNVREIGSTVFAETGGRPLRIVLGDKPPKMGINLFAGINEEKKIILQVPAGSRHLYTEDWIGGFKGRGWDGNELKNGSVNANITLTFETYTP